MFYDATNQCDRNHLTILFQLTKGRRGGKKGCKRTRKSCNKLKAQVNVIGKFALDGVYKPVQSGSTTRYEHQERKKYMIILNKKGKFILKRKRINEKQCKKQKKKCNLKKNKKEKLRCKDKIKCKSEILFTGN